MEWLSFFFLLLFWLFVLYNRLSPLCRVKSVDFFGLTLGAFSRNTHFIHFSLFSSVWRCCWCCSTLLFIVLYMGNIMRGRCGVGVGTNIVCAVCRCMARVLHTLYYSVHTVRKQNVDIWHLYAF